MTTLFPRDMPTSSRPLIAQASGSARAASSNPMRSEKGVTGPSSSSSFGSFMYWVKAPGIW